MNVRQLEAFRATMITGTVTGAGRMLHVSQPAVSQLLHQLEADCGFALFERRHNGLSPTPEAEVIFEEVERMTGAVDRIRRIACSLKEGNWGSIRLAGFPSIAHRFLPEVVADYHQDRPNLRITLESRRSRTLIDWVATQKIDVGIGLLPSDRPDVSSKCLCRFPGVCVLLPNHQLAARDRVRADDLDGEYFISLGTEDRSRVMIDKAFEERQVSRRIRIEAPQSDIACTLVVRGAGVSVVDPFSVYNANSNLISRPFVPMIPFDIWLLTARARKQLGVVDGFIEHLVQRLQAFEVHGSSYIPAEGKAPA